MSVTGLLQVLPSSVERMIIALPPVGATMSAGNPILWYSSIVLAEKRKGVGGEACQ
jgi:hypothetical protein